jgi:phospholipase C
MDASMPAPARHWRRLAVSALALCAMGGAATADPEREKHDGVRTETPIKHVVVVIGENRTFDHVYGAYAPNPSQSILNLLSQGIVKADGSPGPNFAAAKQFTTGAQPNYYVGVSSIQKSPYSETARSADGSRWRSGDRARSSRQPRWRRW